MPVYRRELGSIQKARNQPGNCALFCDTVKSIVKNCKVLLHAIRRPIEYGMGDLGVREKSHEIVIGIQILGH